MTNVNRTKQAWSLAGSLLSLVVVAASPLAAPGGDPSTAIIATPFHDAFAVPGDDSKTHVECDLLD